MKQYLPDPTEVVNALAGRVDVLERRLHVLDQDLTAVGRGVADLTAQIRRLTQQAGRAGTTGPATTEADAEEEAEGQRDWYAVDDPDLAEDWLEEVAQFGDDVLIRHGLVLAEVPCWPLHPDTVSELLALVAQRAEAYAGPQATPVSEWLTRWFPAAHDRIREQVGVCQIEHAHAVSGRGYDARDLTLTQAARWWTTTRHVPAHLALRLPHLH